VIFYLVCLAILVEFLITLGWGAVFFGCLALVIAMVLFRTRRRGWWRLPLSAAALAGCLTSIYSFGVVAALLTCAVVFGIVAAAWAAGHSPQNGAPSRRRPL
jgi:hypothetical protein